MELKTVLVTQARMGSSRLPGKVAKEIQGESLLKIHLNRIQKAKGIDKIIVATTTNPEDEAIYNDAINAGFGAYRGSVDDVLDRFYQAVKDIKPQWVVRVTSDCPLIDPELIDEVVNFVQENDKDYGSNVLIENFPDGQDIEVFKFSALEKSWKEAHKFSEREHVTLHIRNNADVKGGSLFTAINFPCEVDYSKIRMTVDEAKDFELVKILIEAIGTDKSWREYTDYIIDHNLNLTINNGIIRNEGLVKSLKKDN